MADNKATHDTFHQQDPHQNNTLYEDKESPDSWSNYNAPDQRPNNCELPFDFMD